MELEGGRSKISLLMCVGGHYCHGNEPKVEYMRRGLEQVLVCGDVYRRDTVDSTHYPAFHQVATSQHVCQLCPQACVCVCMCVCHGSW